MTLAENRKCQSIYNCLYFPSQHPACKSQFLPPHPSVCMELPVSILLKKPCTPMEQVVEKWCLLYHPSTLCSWEQRLEALKPIMLDGGWNLKNFYCSNIIHSDCHWVKKMEYAVTGHSISSRWYRSMDSPTINGDTCSNFLAHKLFKKPSHY